MYRAKENLDHIKSLIRSINKYRSFRDPNRRNNLCEGAEECMERIQKSIRHFNDQITKHEQNLRDLQTKEDPASLNCTRLADRIKALRWECISLDFYHDNLNDLNQKYCQDKTVVLPRKIELLELEVYRSPKQGGFGLPGKLASMFYRDTFAFYLHKIWAWLHSLFG